MSINTPPITPQQYEVLHGRGAEAAEIAKQRLSRRRFLRRSLLAVWGLSATASVSGAVYLLYPNLSGQFGSTLTVGTKADFPAPRSLDRFALSFNGEDVVVDTQTLNNTVPHPDFTTRLISVPTVLCSA